MKKLETKLKQLQNAHTMSDSERKQLRASLSEYMELNPMRTPIRAARSPLSLHYLWQHKLVSATLALTLFFGSGAGAVYASVDALPGDTLYKIKTLTETTQEMLKITEEAKVRFAERLTERREMELKRLEELGKLDDEKLKIIEKRMIKHKKRAQNILMQLEEMESMQAQEILERIDVKISRVDNVKLSRLIQRFNIQIQQIDQEFNQQESILRDLEKELTDLEKIIPNL